jgi:hypothetical protein
VELLHRSMDRPRFATHQGFTSRMRLRDACERAAGLPWAACPRSVARRPLKAGGLASL